MVLVNLQVQKNVENFITTYQGCSKDSFSWKTVGQLVVCSLDLMVSQSVALSKVSY
jgi:hypothetical protein